MVYGNEMYSHVLGDIIFLNGAFQCIAGLGFQFDSLIGGQPVQHILLNGLFSDFRISAAGNLLGKFFVFLVQFRFGLGVKVLSLSGAFDPNGSVPDTVFSLPGSGTFPVAAFSYKNTFL